MLEGLIGSLGFGCFIILFIVCFPFFFKAAKDYFVREEFPLTVGEFLFLLAMTVAADGLISLTAGLAVSFISFLFVRNPLVVSSVVILGLVVYLCKDIQLRGRG